MSSIARHLYLGFNFGLHDLHIRFIKVTTYEKGIRSIEQIKKLIQPNEKTSV